MPCYAIDNVDAQRGKGVFDGSIRGLKQLNAVGYGRDETGLVLNLVYNPQGPCCRRRRRRSKPITSACSARPTASCSRACTPSPTSDPALRRNLSPRASSTSISRCCSTRISTPTSTANAPNLISVDYRGYVYDCDFNQMLGLPLAHRGAQRMHVSDLIGDDWLATRSASPATASAVLPVRARAVAAR